MDREREKRLVVLDSSDKDVCYRAMMSAMREGREQAAYAALRMFFNRDSERERPQGFVPSYAAAGFGNVALSLCKDDVELELSYPRPELADAHNTVYEHVRVSLMDTRAADDIRVSYSFERDGWLIEQQKFFAWASTDDMDEGWTEVAFCQAWQCEEQHHSMDVIHGEVLRCDDCSRVLDDDQQEYRRDDGSHDGARVCTPCAMNGYALLRCAECEEQIPCGQGAVTAPYIRRAQNVVVCMSCHNGVDDDG